MRVKICGIKEVAHALVTAHAGADYIGVNFYPHSPRLVSPEQAKTIVDAVRSEMGSQRPLLVGVFVNEKADKINEMVESCRLDMVQLSGEEPWEMVKALKRPAIKAIRMLPDDLVPNIAAQMERGFPILLATDSLCLLDAAVPGYFGGTGRRLNWEAAAILAKDYPFILAGGLTPDNVAQAIETLNPWGVDVASGVETAGVKDADKIRAFIAATREASKGVRTAEA